MNVRIDEAWHDETPRSIHRASTGGGQFADFIVCSNREDAAPGEELEYDGFRFTAVEVEGRRIRKVRVRPPVNADRDDDSSEVRERA